MFRFSIRELMLITLVAALAMAWWIARIELKQQRAAVRQYRALYMRIPSPIRNSDDLMNEFAARLHDDRESR